MVDDVKYEKVKNGAHHVEFLPLRKPLSQRDSDVVHHPAAARRRDHRLTASVNNTRIREAN